MNLYDTDAAAAMLGEELVRARQLRRVTRSGLAMTVGVSRVTLANLEAGRGSVSSLVAALRVLKFRFSGQSSELELGRWIAQSRKRVGLSQERLCALAGVSKPALVRVERDQGNVASLVRAMIVMNSPLTLVAEEVLAESSPLSLLRRDFIQGDCVEVLQEMAADTINLVITSPPYNIQKEYENKLTLDQYEQDARLWCAEASRVLSTS